MKAIGYDWHEVISKPIFLYIPQVCSCSCSFCTVWFRLCLKFSESRCIDLQNVFVKNYVWIPQAKCRLQTNRQIPWA